MPGAASSPPLPGAAAPRRRSPAGLCSVPARPGRREAASLRTRPASSRTCLPTTRRSTPGSAWTSTRSPPSRSGGPPRRPAPGSTALAGPFLCSLFPACSPCQALGTTSSWHEDPRSGRSGALKSLAAPSRQRTRRKADASCSAVRTSPWTSVPLSSPSSSPQNGCPSTLRRTTSFATPWTTRWNAGSCAGSEATDFS